MNHYAPQKARERIIKANIQLLLIIQLNLRYINLKYLFTIVAIIAQTLAIVGCSSTIRAAKSPKTSADSLAHNIISALDSIAESADTTKLKQIESDSSLIDSAALNSLKTDSLALDSTDLDSLQLDSTAMDSVQVDSVQLDSIAAANRKPFLEDPIFGKNKDSLTYDMTSKIVSVFGQGEIEYQDMSLKADRITLSTESKNIAAKGIVTDSVKNEMSRPEFKQGEEQFIVDSMQYNMDSGKARIKGVSTKEGDGTLSGGTVKRLKDNTIHMHNGRYTVCDAKCPHFYLQMTKGTVVPDKMTIFGPSYMVFEDVPLYFLGLPFGFFPQTTTRKSGIIIPSIGEEYVKGFFLRDGGFYWAVNDYVDLRVVGGIYTLGSWQVGAASNYSLRYKFNGSIGFDYAADKIGEKSSPDYVDTRNVNIRWTHTQDPRFLPGSTFSASVNYSSSTYNKYNAQDMEDYLSAQTSSAINYSKNWTGKPYSMSVNAAMSQNMRDSTITMALPNFTFNVMRIAPFKRKNAVGKERWYEKISFTYNNQIRNEVTNIKEDIFFKDQMFEEMKAGVSHSIPVSASFNVARYLNITPSVNYNEKWLFKKIDQSWNEADQAVAMDTTSGFYRLWDISTSVAFNTKLYGTYTLGKRDKPTAIFRHIFTPSFSLSYTPDNGSRYYRETQTNADGTISEYNPYQGQMFSPPSKGEVGAISFSLGNTLEAKFKSKNDTSGYKKIKLLESFNISSGYNFMADSLKLSPFSVQLRTNIADVFPIQLNATFDPYQDIDGRRIDKFRIEDGGFLKMTALNFSLGYGFKSSNSRPSGQTAVNNPLNNNNSNEMAMRSNLENNMFAASQNNNAAGARLSPRDLAMLASSQYYDFNIPWSLNVDYSFNYTNTNEARLQHSIEFNGSINITDKWGLSASAGYDLTMNKLTPGTVRITRDLHCWQMSLQWIPIGFRQSWSFNIAVKSSTLSDLLKWEKDRSFFDNQYSGY